MEEELGVAMEETPTPTSTVLTAEHLIEAQQEGEDRQMRTLRRTFIEVHGCMRVKNLYITGFFLSTKL